MFVDKEVEVFEMSDEGGTMIYALDEYIDCTSSRKAIVKCSELSDCYAVSVDGHDFILDKDSTKSVFKKGNWLYMFVDTQQQVSSKLQ